METSRACDGSGGCWIEPVAFRRAGRAGRRVAGVQSRGLHVQPQVRYQLAPLGYRQGRQGRCRHGADTRASGSRQVVLARLVGKSGRPPSATSDPEGCHSPGLAGHAAAQEPVGQLGSHARASRPRPQPDRTATRRALDTPLPLRSPAPSCPGRPQDRRGTGVLTRSRGAGRCRPPSGHRQHVRR